MPLFDTTTLDNDFDGAALLASVLYATPGARAEARERGRERLARAGSLVEAMTADARTASAQNSAAAATASVA